MGRIPEFPASCEVDLELVDELRPVLRGLRPELAEFTFANLYLFRNAHAYRICHWRGFLLITARGYDGGRYAFPPLGEGDVEEAARLLCGYLQEEGAPPVLFPVPRVLLGDNFARGGWTWELDRDQADYVYSRDDLAQLAGKKYHKRRNRLLKFLREEVGEYQYEELRDGHVAECRDLATGWCEIRCSADRPSTFLETAATLEALEHRENLGLRGAVIREQGRVRAFCLGEELNPETFVVHFEKAEPGREGLAQLINRDFCLRGLAGYRFVNREQDLGDPGLRQAKEAYHPILLTEKFRVRPA